ncbi:hypothetical protein FRC05_009212 [Tulasnella sp. 425]|nr:hypothetical protein FRC05_009212 [Tulasnella sp. 425]
MIPNATSIAYLQTQIVSAVPINIDHRLAESAKSLAFCLVMVASVHGMKALTRAVGDVVELTTTGDEEEEDAPRRGRQMERTYLGIAKTTSNQTSDKASP